MWAEELSVCLCNCTSCIKAALCLEKGFNNGNTHVVSQCQTVTILTYHDSRYSQQQGSDESRGANRHDHPNRGVCWRRRRRGHLWQGETTVLHSCYLPQRSINIHFTTLIPNLINDVKAMTQQSLGSAMASACQFFFLWRGMISFHLSKLKNKCAHWERPYWDRDLLWPSITELSTACHYWEQICKL